MVRRGGDILLLASARSGRRLAEKATQRRNGLAEQLICRVWSELFFFFIDSEPALHSSPGVTPPPKAAGGRQKINISRTLSDCMGIIY